MPPLPDGPHGPSTRANVLARLSLGLTAGMAVALVIAMTHALGDPSQFVGVTVLALITASLGCISVALWRGLRRATVRVDAAGLILPRVSAVERARTTNRIPCTELGECFVFVAAGQRPSALHGTSPGRCVRGETRYGLMLSAFIAPAWGADVVLGLATRGFGQTGQQLALTRAWRLPTPGELGATLTEARAWSGARLARPRLRLLQRGGH